MFELTKKVAFVTGGRRGMGRTHALALAEQGARVVVADIDQNECMAVVEEIRSKGGEAICFQMDVSNKAEIEHVFDEVIKQYGRLDILVNNAGIYIPKPALELTEEEWDKTIDINLKGQFLCAQRAAKEMAKINGGGSSIYPRLLPVRLAWESPAARIIPRQKAGLSACQRP
ncbi:SDR family NAD(P)-dependent oxidoreductase [Candidatus Azambacteria bacterium]|nr:SDR family NAD(P)-dependent oxidoreductase [Candidatus Azambacteria bacterium]